MVGAGRFERPTPCAQDGFRSPANSACFQLLAFQAVAAILLRRVERFGILRRPTATFLSTSYPWLLHLRSDTESVFCFAPASGYSTRPAPPAALYDPVAGAVTDLAPHALVTRGSRRGPKSRRRWTRS